MKIAWFDCFSGVSGDMCLGALVDSGVPLKAIERELKKLRLKGYSLRQEKVIRAGIASTKVDVLVSSGGMGKKSEARKWLDIQKIIKESALPTQIRDKGLRIFRALFEAEAKVHGKSISATHLHELGAVDCIVDIFGTLSGLSFLGIERIYASALNLGSGKTKTSHGVLPVPAPATAELLKGVPCYASGPSFEMTTPTGAAILKTLSSGFGPMPFFTPEIIGNGAGNKDPEEQPNVLRLMIGESVENAVQEQVIVMETNIDDMNPQVYEYVMDRLFRHGALEVFLTQVLMKKTRPGIKLTVLCTADKQNELLELILKETTTLGVRFYVAGRLIMKRRIKQVRTKYGTIRVKQSELGDLVRSTPEYEDCRKAAEKKEMPLVRVLAGIKKA
jgi:uncharacterized protein (TIGR00299 family) protein